MYRKIELKLGVDAVVPNNFEDLKYADKLRYIWLNKETCIIRIKEVVIKKEGLK